MVISFKDSPKFVGIIISACCAVFVCTLFSSYNADILTLDISSVGEAGKILYDAQTQMAKVIITVTGGCLGVTTAVMLTFYIKNYIDGHGKELGILKAMGYSDISIAKRFCIFASIVFLGCLAGFTAAFMYLPAFYEKMNADKLLPDMTAEFHPILPVFLIILPSAIFAILSVSYAFIKLKSPPIALLKGLKRTKTMAIKGSKDKSDFLLEIKRITIKSRKSLAFFVAFSAFCFSAMVQMSLSMNELSSETFSYMIFTIGIILAFTTLFMSLSNVVKGNADNIAIMRAFGYEDKECRKCIFNPYRPFSYIGFITGTVYQYVLLKIVMTLMFSKVEILPEYNFSIKALAITLIAFIAAYETIIYIFSLKIKSCRLKI